ncbi:hypothetical protein [Lentimicrobium sp. S6]|uniref:hypothetical protein n=1 Tax=Lentimicrobium sp. S6 TaxID=2735872 RepID=UPI0015534A51|nr:hypothetical protein [Lentimicrobium sp. S6]NPD47110.1 hypothetical protein [Lentimicrobium sp. S6]
MKPITKDIIQKAKSPNIWDLGNQTLYNLCKEHFEHKNDEAIIAKVWLIGRAYAAAIERRKNAKETNDNFYSYHVLNAFKKSDLDLWLKELELFDNVTIENIPLILTVHKKLVDLIKGITAMEKRSFTSKYLHFHLPHLFYIYDSRAVEDMRKHTSRVPNKFNQILKHHNFDDEYAKFACKCLAITEEIEKQHHIKLSPRELDNFLLYEEE